MSGDVYVFIQIRTSSTRLPGKALLSIAGFPLAISLYKRVSNTGLGAIILTSDDRSDDYLCQILSKFDVPYKRGSLDNVLSRFLNASESLEDEDIIIRLTGDNIVPDGEFIDEAIQFYKNNDCEYLCSSTNLPYGLSLEIFKKYMLIESAQEDTSKENIEHVTPYIRKKFRTTYFESEVYVSSGRVTIDFLEDYIQMGKLFESFKDPINIKSKDLIKKVQKKILGIEKIILGGAQLGSDYGISNNKKLTYNDSVDLLLKATELGIEYIDTAIAYGASESIVGKFSRYNNIKVITKLAPTLTEEESPKEALFKSLLKSKKNLNGQEFDTLMFHRAEHAIYRNGTLINALEDLKKDNNFSKIGVSIQNPEELLKLSPFLSRFNVLQVPYNLFDYRWSTYEIETILNNFSKENEIHVRSCYLQGAIFIEEASKWPRINSNYDANKIIQNLNFMANKYNTSISGLALNFVLNTKWATKVVLGFGDASQISQTSDLIQTNLMIKQEDIDYLRSFIPLELLNPANWRL